jgi:hypothetical protein
MIKRQPISDNRLSRTGPWENVRRKSSHTPSAVCLPQLHQFMSMLWYLRASDEWTVKYYRLWTPWCRHHKTCFYLELSGWAEIAESCYLSRAKNATQVYTRHFHCIFQCISYFRKRIHWMMRERKSLANEVAVLGQKIIWKFLWLQMGDLVLPIADFSHSLFNFFWSWASDNPLPRATELKRLGLLHWGNHTTSRDYSMICC